MKIIALILGYFIISVHSISIPFFKDTTIQSTTVQGEKSEIGLESSEFSENEGNTPVDNPTFPLFSGLPSFGGINLGLPSLQNFTNINIQNPFPQRPPIKATKTEYVEITRRQTIHPVCYTSLKHKPNCLPYHRNDEDSKLEIDDGMSVQIETETDVNESENNSARDPKYIEFAKHKPSASATTEIESSISSQEARHPFQRVTEWATKTVLVTRVERYTDHRVTATLIAKNCIPVNPNIPKCHTRASVIVETPNHLIGEASLNTPIIIASVVASEDSDQIVNAMKAVDEASQAFANKKLTETPTILSPMPPAETDSDSQQGQSEEAEEERDDVDEIEN